MGIIRPGPIRHSKTRVGLLKPRYRRVSIVFSLVVSLVAIGLWRIAQSPISTGLRDTNLASYLGALGPELDSQVALAKELGKIRADAPGYSRQEIVTNLVNLEIAFQETVQSINEFRPGHLGGYSLLGLNGALSKWTRGLENFTLATFAAIGPGYTPPVSPYGSLGTTQLYNQIWSKAQAITGSTGITTRFSLATENLESGDREYESFANDLRRMIPDQGSTRSTGVAGLNKKSRSIRENKTNEGPTRTPKVKVGSIGKPTRYKPLIATIEGMPRSIAWISSPALWTSQSMASFETDLATSQSLQPVHQVAIVSGSITPAPIPDLVGSSNPILIGSKLFGVLVVVTNRGNVQESAVPIRLQVTSTSKLPPPVTVFGAVPTTTQVQTGPTQVTLNKTVTLDPSQTISVAFSAINLAQNYTYSVAVQLGPVSGQSSTQGLTYQTQFELES